MLLINLGGTKGQVVADGVIKYHDILGDVSNAPPPGGKVNLTQVHTIYQNSAIMGPLQACNEVDDGRFSSSRTADDSHHLMAFNLQIDIINGLQVFVGIPERDVLQGETSLKFFKLPTIPAHGFRC